MRLTVSQMTTAFTYLSLLRALPEDVDIPPHYFLAKIAKNTSLQSASHLNPENAALIPSLYHTAKHVINYTAHKPLMHLALRIESFIRNEKRSIEDLSKQNIQVIKQLHQEYQEQLLQLNPLILLLQQLQKASLQTTDQLILETALFSTPSSDISSLDLSALSSSEIGKNLLSVQTTVEKIFQTPRTIQRIKINHQRLEKGKEELVQLESTFAKINRELSLQMDYLEELMQQANCLNIEKSLSLLTLEKDADRYLLTNSKNPSLQ